MRAPSLVFAPVDFERDDLAEALAKAGVDRAAPTFFMWLGVTPYLSPAAIMATLRVAAAAPGAEVVFDYSERREREAGEARAFHEALQKGVAAVGEPMIGFLDPAELSRDLAALGMNEQEDLGIPEIAVRFFGAPPGSVPSGSAGHIIWARRPLDGEGKA